MKFLKRKVFNLKAVLWESTRRLFLFINFPSVWNALKCFDNSVNGQLWIDFFCQNTEGVSVVCWSQFFSNKLRINSINPHSIPLKLDFFR